MTAPTPLAGTPTKMGPGTLTVGAPGSSIDFSGRCTKVAVKWKGNKTTDVEVLSGETLAGDRSWEATLEATVYQDDLVAGGLVDYSWSHRGEEVPFSFTPYATGRSITGRLVIDPLDVGGDVGSKNTSDLKWGTVGEPELTDDLS